MKLKNPNIILSDAENFMNEFHGLSFIMTNDKNGKIIEVKTDDKKIIAWLKEKGFK